MYAQNSAIIVLTIVVMLAFVIEATTATSSNTLNANTLTSRRTLDASLNGNYTFEDRGFSGMTKMNDLVHGGTDKLHKLAESAKTKFTPKSAIGNLFLQFKLDKVESNVFKSNEFEKWANSVTKAYKTSPEAADTAMLTTLSARYGDESVANMLAYASGIIR
ncbi:hypothetical protein L914_14884 [Phytophthora nicotianae]|uniref:RxLR effector protein n=1 Tax=Phytophthora nicotianae TaxID=4792 RepID=W2MTE2_PHYNI|nr:hypothetical protein L914_14884 [Phytophthora nicotianae]